MPRFPYVVEIPKSRDMQWVTVSEGVIRAPNADAAEKKVRQKFPKAQHIEIMAAVPLDEENASTWELIEPYIGIALCFLIAAGFLVGAFMIKNPLGPPPPPAEEAVEIQTNQQSDTRILEEPEDFPEWNLYDLE